MSRISRRRSAWLVGLAAIALLYATAVPSSAAPTGTKYYSFTVSPSSVTAGTQNQVFQVTITNTSPKGSSSNISSVSIAVPSQFTVVGTPTIDGSSTNPNASATVTLGSGGTFCNQGDGQTVNVCSLDPIKRVQSVTVNITTNVTSSNLTCGNDNLSNAWLIEANTGSQLNGNNFDPNPTQPVVQTQIGLTCSLAFVPNHTPLDAVKSTDIKGSAGDVQVALYKGNSIDTNFTGAVTLVKASGPAATIGGNGPTNAVLGVASFPHLQLDTIGTYTLKAQSPGYSDSAASPSFQIFNSGITCNGTSGPITGGGTTSTLDRTDDGPSTGCIDVPYTLTSDTSTVTLQKDQATVVQQGAQFSLTITWGVAANNYPNFGTTTFDLDGNFQTTGDQFVPDSCTVVNGVAQPPKNPDTNGNYWPAGNAEQPWCLATTTIAPSGDHMQVTETFLGSGDPVISRSK